MYELNVSKLLSTVELNDEETQKVESHARSILANTLDRDAVILLMYTYSSEVRAGDDSNLSYLKILEEAYKRAVANASTEQKAILDLRLAESIEAFRAKE